MTLTKKRIINSIHKRLNLPKTKSANALENLLKIIKKTLQNEEDILIRGFGKFSVKNGNGRKGRTPATSEEMTPESKRAVTFTCSPVLKDKMNDRE